ncbi:MAG: phosphoglycerate kinase [Candidatus Aminicenantes bacterium RBG_13_63_10]|nr:MAG: phosphoglycerate kinase [Candidatus Aminicenantes bacterium RBG_13_63_10]
MKSLTDLPVEGRTVLVRVDFNVPLDETGQIRDDTRIRASLPTLNELIGRKARVVVCSHLGRPKGQVVPKLSLRGVAARLSELLGREVRFSETVIGPEVGALKKSLKDGEVLLLENVRFHAAETSNDDAFAGRLAEGADFFVNDAFGSCHRAHASVEAVTRHVRDSAAGLLLEKEVDYLSRAFQSPVKPYTAILGGAKVSDKIPVIENLLNKADDILIGGAMAYTFFKARGLEVGKSLVESDKLDTARAILNAAEKMKVSFLLPEDHVLAGSLEQTESAGTTDAFPLPQDMMAVDIGPKTVESYSRVIARSKTIFWNGPLGVFEVPAFSRGTVSIAEAVARSEALSIVGGGDSAAAIARAGVGDRISHISTGGGASLEFLAYETLPGLEALGWKK